MKVQVIARQMESESDNDLRALDAIQFGPVHEVDELTVDVEERLLNEFETLFTEESNWKHIKVERTDNIV